MTGAEMVSPGQQVDQVLVFYSGRNEPRLLDSYKESLQYLEQSSFDIEVIDVDEETERARDHDVLSTPLVIVKRGDKTKRHFGIVDGLQSILEEDLYGKSILHQIGFKEGRKFVQDNGLEEAGREAVQDALREHFDHVAKLEIKRLDREEEAAEGSIKPSSDRDKSQRWHSKLEEFLGGVFTEVFGTGVMVVETKCAYGEAERCVFETETKE